METLLIEIESPTKARELSSMLSSMDFIKNISLVNKRKELIDALQENEIFKTSILKNKNKAIAKYLE